MSRSLKEYKKVVDGLKSRKIPSKVKLEEDGTINIELGFDYPDLLSEKVFDMLDELDIKADIMAETSARGVESESIYGGPQEYEREYDDDDDYYAKGGVVDAQKLADKAIKNLKGYSKSWEAEENLDEEINDIIYDNTSFSESNDKFYNLHKKVKKLTLKEFPKGFAKGGKIVWVGDMPLDIDGREELTEEEAERLAKEWKEKGYDDVIIEDYAKGGMIGGKKILTYVKVLENKDKLKKGDILPVIKINSNRYNVDYSVVVHFRGKNYTLILQDEMRGVSGETEFTGYEPFAKGGRVMSIDRLATKLRRAYPNIRMREYDDSISVFEDFPTDRRGDSIADYYSESQDRVFGMANHFDNFLKRNGYWAEWVNPEHFKIYKLDNYAKGGEVKKKGNEMIMGGLAGLLLGIFLNK